VTRVFHRTTEERADAIEREGFRDNRHGVAASVALSERHSFGPVLFWTDDIPDAVLYQRRENWVGYKYRHGHTVFALPAAVANAYTWNVHRSRNCLGPRRCPKCTHRIAEHEKIARRRALRAERLAR
jgi:hypothetical protein